MKLIVRVITFLMVSVISTLAMAQAGNKMTWAVSDAHELPSSSGLVFSDSYALQPMNLVTLQGMYIDDYRQLAPFRVVQFAGYRYTAEFEQAERTSTVDIYRPQQGYQMLLSKRADVLVIDGLLFNFAQRRDDALQDLEISPLVVSVDSMHFGFAQNHPRSAQFIEALNQAIDIFDVAKWLDGS